jgi:hypothetical protein
MLSLGKEERMTVFITHEMRGKDLSNALDFGPLQVILPAELQFTENSKSKQEIIDLIEEVLNGFSDSDYLLLSGDPACIGVCFAVAALNNDGAVKVLKWDRQMGCYYAVTIGIDMEGESNVV